MSESEMHDDPQVKPKDRDMENQEADISGHYLSDEVEFTPWHEEPLPREAESGLGHRRVVKKKDIIQGKPVNIVHEVSLEPEPELEDMEIFPVKKDGVLIGLKIECGCGRNHEVRFEYDDVE
jgi:hypothetical protein